MHEEKSNLSKEKKMKNGSGHKIKKKDAAHDVYNKSDFKRTIF